MKPKNSIKSVSKHKPCPICGYADWCGFMQASEGGELVACQRDTEETNTIGRDGKFYVFVAKSKTGASSIYEEANQRMQKEEDFKKNKTFNTYKEYKKTYTVVDNVVCKSNEELNKIYRAMLNLMVLDDEHRKYLHGEGWTDELIEKHNIKSFPEKDFTRFIHKNNFSYSLYRKNIAKKLIEEFGDDALIGVPGAFRDSKGNWTFAGRKGIFFPIYDANNNLYRLRIRLDFMDVNEKLVSSKDYENRYFEKDDKKFFAEPLKGIYTLKDNNRIYEKGTGKYRNFSSYHLKDDEYKKGFIINTYDKGCEAGNQIGVYYNYMKDSMYLAYITEGEKKGIFSSDKLKAPVISLPGVNSFAKLIEGKAGTRAIDILKEKGVKMFVIAFDADKSINARVMESERQTIELLQNEGFIIGVAEWDMNIGKGLDDLLAAGQNPKYQLV